MKQTMTTALQLAAILLTVLLGSTAVAAILTVNSLSDSSGIDDGIYSLREAIAICAAAPVNSHDQRAVARPQVATATSALSPRSMGRFG